MMRLIASICIVAIGFLNPAAAQSVQEKDAAALKPMADLVRKTWTLQPGKPVSLNMPLFDRVIQFALPSGYVPAYQAQSPNAFLMEFVLDGEGVESLTKLVTITSTKGTGSFALDDLALAKVLVGSFSGCEGYSHFEILGNRRIDNEVGEVSVSKGCGGLSRQAYQTAQQGNGEQAVMLFFRDALNTYTIQFAERGAAFTAASIPISNDRAKAILAGFGQVLLCAPASVTPSCKTALAAEAVRNGLGKRP